MIFILYVYDLLVDILVAVFSHLLARVFLAEQRHFRFFLLQLSYSTTITCRRAPTKHTFYWARCVDHGGWDSTFTLSLRPSTRSFELVSESWMIKIYDFVCFSLTSPLAQIFLSSLLVFLWAQPVTVWVKGNFLLVCSAAQNFRFSSCFILSRLLIGDFFICWRQWELLSGVRTASYERGTLAESLAEHPEPRNLDNNRLKETLFVSKSRRVLMFH